jgi:Nif-specific regulatory protein
VPPAPTLRADPEGDAEAGDLEPGTEQNERQRVVAALEQAGWVQARAARLLGMTPRQIAYRIQTLNIEVRQI